MAAATTLTAPAISVTVVEEGVEFAWTDEAMDRWEDRSGLRWLVGVAYIETDNDGRKVLVDNFGVGMIRRSLLVVAKSDDMAEMSDEMFNMVVTLRDALKPSNVKALKEQAASAA